MPLTKRAHKFLELQEVRSDAIREKRVIQNLFEKNEIEISESFMEFQLKYGGLIQYAGREPICFGIAHGNLSRGDFKFSGNWLKKLRNPKPSLIIYEPDPELNPDLHLACADTLYQVEFTMDTRGWLYEDWSCCARNFDSVIEDHAIFHELDSQGYRRDFTVYFDDEVSLVDNEGLVKALSLEPYENYPQDVVYWGSSEGMILRIGNSSIAALSNKFDVSHLKTVIKSHIQTR